MATCVESALVARPYAMTASSIVLCRALMCYLAACGAMSFCGWSSLLLRCLDLQKIVLWFQTQCCAVMRGCIEFQPTHVDCVFSRVALCCVFFCCTVWFGTQLFCTALCCNVVSSCDVVRTMENGIVKLKVCSNQRKFDCCMNCRFDQICNQHWFQIKHVGLRECEEI